MIKINIVKVIENEKMVELCKAMIKEILIESVKYCNSNEKTQNISEFVRVSDEILLSTIKNLIEMNMNSIKITLEFLSKNKDEQEELFKKDLSPDEKDKLIDDLMKRK